MGIIDRFFKKKAVDAPQGEHFNKQLNEALVRYRKASSGSMEVEAVRIEQRLRDVEAVESQDIADLVALTQVLVTRFEKDRLKQWLSSVSIEDIWPEIEKQLMVDERERKALPVSSWFADMKQSAREVHNAEIEEDAYGWLVEWQPSEPSLHNIKLEALRTTNAGILADMLATLASREIELVETPPENVPKDVDHVFHDQTELWQCITETRVMRHAIEEALVEAHDIPTDYKEALKEQRPEVQLAFLVDHQDYFDELKASA